MEPYGKELGSELSLGGPATVEVKAKVSAYLPGKPDPSLPPYNRVLRDRGGKLSKWAGELKPFWHIERARIGDSRDVKVEVVVNGYPVAEKVVAADGTLRELSFDVKLERSSWVTMRILGSSHTNPVFVLVDGKPIRASKRSAEWCLKGVDQCWSQKERHIAKEEMKDAIDAYEHARRVYRKILSESEVD